MPPACRPTLVPSPPTSFPAATTGVARENCRWESVSRIPMGGLDAKSWAFACKVWKLWTCFRKSDGNMRCLRKSSTYVLFTMWYPLVNFFATMDNHHFQWVNQQFLWPCSIVILVYQRVNHLFPMIFPISTLEIPWATVRFAATGVLRRQDGLHQVQRGLLRARRALPELLRNLGYVEAPNDHVPEKCMV